MHRMLVVRQAFVSALIFVFSFAACAQTTLISGGGTPTASIIYNIRDYTSCNGAGNDIPGFATWLSVALTYQGSNPGKLIELDIPSGAVCMFNGVGTSPSIFAGLKNLLVSGYGATFSDNSGAGNGFFPGGGVLAGVKHDSTVSTVLLATVNSGSSTVTLLDPSKLALWAVGDWALIAGLAPQAGIGYPPNPMFFEFVQVLSKNVGAGTITFVSPLTNTYKSTWPVHPSSSAFEADQGGPATLYSLGQNWVTNQEYRGLTISQVGQTYAVGQYITYRDVTFTGTACGIPTQNYLFRLINMTMTNCSMEVDKVIQTAVFDNVTIRSIDFQSASINNFTITDSSITNFINGTPRVTTITGSNINSFSPGAHSYGASGEVTISDTVLTSITPLGASQSDINVRGSWVLGKLSVPKNFTITSAADNGSGLIRLLVSSTTGYSTGFVTDITVLAGSASCSGVKTLTVVDGTHFDIQGSTFSATCSGNGGSIPLNWAVPGANIKWTARWPNMGPVAQITDVSEDSTFVYVQTTLPGAFPTMPVSSQNPQVFVHPAPKFTCTNCTGSVDAVDLSNPGAAGQPIWSYSKRTLVADSCVAIPPLIPIWGALTSLSITVMQAYAGASLTININDPFIQALGSATTPDWNAIVNAKIASGTPRLMTPTATSGSQSGDSLVAPGASTWLVSNQIREKCSAVIAGGGDPLMAVYEFITNQGVVYP